ncbi:hypothetical protein [Leptolyngbya sp. NIES-2104]|uniref:hypothetical protein n=1 Tax=Leptolyngbya sp. NIES-2104 TaxID=1552121 RepID=UPI0006ECCC1C|nr:hypothetical protein [Leptolyngbya sp. NIES-2104]GAP98055.1 hypothetical protein NIES2104_46080 [Leptolyngbya sp. NIES-2104]
MRTTEVRRDRRFGAELFCSTLVLVLAMSSANAEPKLTGSPQTLTISGTNCVFNPLGCTPIIRHVLLQTNEPISALQVIPSDLNRADGATVVPASSIQAKLPTPSIRPDQPLSFPIAFDLQNVTSGEFTGELLAVHSTGEFRIPLIVRIKAFWLLPFIVLFGGVILGFGISRYRAEGIPRDEVVVQVGRLRNQMRADSEVAQSFQVKINAHLVDIETALEAKRWDTAQQSTALAQAVWDKWRKNREDWLIQLRYLAQLDERCKAEDPSGQLPYVQAVHHRIDGTIRTAVNQEDSQQLHEIVICIQRELGRYLAARNQLDEFNQQMSQLANDQPWKRKAKQLQAKLDRLSPQDNESLKAWQDELDGAIAELNQAIFAEAADTMVLPELTATRGSTKFSAAFLEPVPMIGASSDITQTARRRLGGFKLLSYVVATLLLAGLGFRELYSNNATFGSNGVTDYFSLLAWGFGAEVTRESVTQVIRESRLPGLNFGGQSK